MLKFTRRLSTLEGLEEFRDKARTKIDNFYGSTRTLVMEKSKVDIKTLKFWKGCVAELIGSMLMVIFGCGAFTETDVEEHPLTLRVALTFGLIYGIMVHALKGLSGGFLNPSTTIAMVVTKRLNLARGVMYCFMQFIGAMIGAGLLLAMTPVPYRDNMGCTVTALELSAEQGFAVELFISFFFVFVVCACNRKVPSKDRYIHRMYGPFIIGFAAIATHLFALPYTGASMNPARSFGPAVVNGVWKNHWIYWFGPIVGGTLGGVVQQLLMGSKAAIKRMHSCITGSDDEEEESEEEDTAYNDYQMSRSQRSQPYPTKPAQTNHAPNLQAVRGGILSRTASYGGDSLAMGIEGGTDMGNSKLKPARLEKRPSFDINSTKVHEINGKDSSDPEVSSDGEARLNVEPTKQAEKTPELHRAPPYSPRIAPSSPLVRQAAAIRPPSPELTDSPGEATPPPPATPTITPPSPKPSKTPPSPNMKAPVRPVASKFRKFVKEFIINKGHHKVLAIQRVAEMAKAKAESMKSSPKLPRSGSKLSLHKRELHRRLSQKSIDILCGQKSSLQRHPSTRGLDRCGSQYSLQRQSSQKSLSRQSSMISLSNQMSSGPRSTQLERRGSTMSIRSQGSLLSPEDSRSNLLQRMGSQLSMEIDRIPEVSSTESEVESSSSATNVSPIHTVSAQVERRFSSLDDDSDESFSSLNANYLIPEIRIDGGQKGTGWQHMSIELGPDEFDDPTAPDKPPRLLDMPEDFLDMDEDPDGSEV